MGVTATFECMMQFGILLSCNSVLISDWFCQLSGSGSNSLNSLFLLHGLGMKLVLLQHHALWKIYLENHGTNFPGMCVHVAQGIAHLSSGVPAIFSDSWRGMRDMGVRGMVLTVCKD